MAGTTTATVYLRPTIRGPQGSGAVVYLAHRQVAGIYSTSIASTPSKKNWKPHALTPIADKDGRITPAWNRYFSDLGSRKLGGATYPTLPDLTEFILLSQATAAAVTQVQTALEQMVNANAQSLQAVVQVTQNAALAGATQIPTVVVARAETTAQPVPVPPETGGGGD